MSFNFTVQVYPFQSEGKTVAFASVTIDDLVKVDGFKIINGKNGLFVSAPQEKGKDKETGADKWFNKVHFIGDTPEFPYQTPVQKEIYDAMVEEYQNKVSQNNRGTSASAQTATPKRTNKRPSPGGSDVVDW